MLTKKEYEDLKKLLIKASKSYYQDSKSIMSDFEYDNKLQDVIEYEKMFGGIDKDSPTQKIGIDSKDNITKHLTKMFSMANVFELKEWEPILKNIGTQELLEEPKLDGVSINLIYDKGKLIHMLTGGDGENGKDVILHQPNIKNIPIKINFLGKIEIRGEIILTQSGVEEVNEFRRKAKLNLISTPRNFVSGYIMSKYLAPTKYDIRFYPWDIGYIENEVFETHLEKLKFLENLGFPKLPFSSQKVINKNHIETIKKYYLEYISNQAKGNYPIDGLVIRYNNLEKVKELGYTSKYPKSIWAFKFPLKESQTTIKNIIWDISRNGLLTPVGVLKPIKLQGTVLTKVKLNNPEYIKYKKLGIGSEIMIYKAGEIIPAINEVIVEKSYDIPQFCPFCNSKTEQKGKHLYCINPECSERHLKYLEYYCSKPVMNLFGVSINTLRKMKGIKSPIDFYSLTETDLKDWGFQPKTISNILNSIEKSKGVPFWRFLKGLGIPGIGTTGAKSLSETYGRDLLKKGTLLHISSGLYANIIEYLHKPGNSENIEKLLDIIKPI